MIDEDAHEAIASHWRTEWAVLHGAMSGDIVTEVLEGEIGESGSEWVQMTIVSMPSALQTLDANQRERNAIIAVQVFSLPVSGTRRATKLVTDVRTVLEAKVLASGSERIWTYAASSSPGVTDGAWIRRLVTVPCRWYG